MSGRPSRWTSPSSRSSPGTNSSSGRLRGRRVLRLARRRKLSGRRVLLQAGARRAHPSGGPRREARGRNEGPASDQRGGHGLLLRDTSGALGRAPLRHFVLREPRPRSVAQGARSEAYGAHGELVGPTPGAPRLGHALPRGVGDPRPPHRGLQPQGRGRAPPQRNRAGRTGGGTLSLAVLDIDWLKSVNEEHGHLAGDACLEHFVSVLGRRVREGDWIARWGGDEFVVGVWQAHGEETSAKRVLERAAGELREDPPVLPSGEEVRLTFSVGVGQWRAGDDVQGLFRKADEALYGPKQPGGTPSSWKLTRASQAGAAHLIHRSAWKENSRKSVSSILY